MTVTETAAVVAAVAAALLVVGLLFAVGALIRTLRSARLAIDDVHRVAMPLLADMHLAVRHASADLSKVDGFLGHAESISGTVDTASRLAFELVSNPAVKAVAVASGGARAFQRLRSGRRSGRQRNGREADGRNGRRANGRRRGGG
jgi:uncharacterized protein YoxC